MSAAFHKISEGLVEALLVARGEAEPARCTIGYSVLQLDGSDLLMAVSDDMKGLMVAGRSTQQIEAELPHAIHEMLEAEGRPVQSIFLLDRERL